MSLNFGNHLLRKFFGNFGVKVSVVEDILSLHEQDFYQTTSLVENSIQFEFQTNRNSYVHLRRTNLVLIWKLSKGRGYGIYNNDETEEPGETQKEEEDAPVLLVTDVKNILESFP